MLAERTDKVIRKSIPFIDITADLADKALLPFRLRFRLDIFLIICVGHGILVGHDSRLCHTADKHTVCAQIHILLNFQRHKGINIVRQEIEAIIRTDRLKIRKLVNRAAAPEAKVLEDGEWSFNRQAVDVEFAGLLDHMIGIILLIDIDSYLVRIV